MKTTLPSVRRTEIIPSETPTGSGVTTTTAGVHAAAVVAGETAKAKSKQTGLTFEPAFSKPGVHPYDEIEWDKRTAEITDDSGKANYFFNRTTGKTERAPTQYEYPQGSACFIQAVDDNMESIMDLARSEAMLFKFGSGTGSDLSTIRSTREKMSGGGRPSGPLSFLKVYDHIANLVKSGGKTPPPPQIN